MHIHNPSRIHILAEAPVIVDITDPVSDIPGPILHGLRGKHVPVVPHAQRLLVAAHKDAKEVQPDDGVVRKRVKGKGGKKQEKTEAEKAPKTEAEKAPAAEAGANLLGSGEEHGGGVSEPKGPTEPKEPRKRVLTAYGVARADYIKALLGFRQLGIASYKAQRVWRRHGEGA